MKFYRIEAQKKIRELCDEGPFFRVNYDTTTREPSVVVSTPINNVTDHVAPAGVEVNEISSGFGEAMNRRGGVSLDRTTWQFQVMVEFNCEVLLERFEQAITARAPIVPRDPQNGLDKQITLRLTQAGYQHPTRQEGSTGTRASYVFEAQISPN